jgi:sulfopyruvate decarboxylase alpha subunit
MRPPSPKGFCRSPGDLKFALSTWHDIIHECLRAQDVRLATYVPDRVLQPLIRRLHDDSSFTTFTCAREEEAVGIVSGAWMAGLRGVVLMQTSGFATLANVLASLPVAYQIPVVMIISERGTLGEFNAGQVLVCRTLRPILEAAGIEHHTVTRLDELQFVFERTLGQAYATQMPAALILNPLLTGGKVFKHA